MDQLYIEEPLMVWWGHISFPGKEHCLLRSNGELVWQCVPGRQKLLAVVESSTADTVTGMLLENYKEAGRRMDVLRREWGQAENRSRLHSKIAECRAYLAGLCAIGDLDAMLAELSEWEKGMADAAEDQYRQKCLIVEEAEQIAVQSEWKEGAAFFREVPVRLKELGYIDRERNDELRRRLEEARDAFYRRKRDDRASQELDMLHNLDRKLEIAEKAELLAGSDDWKATTVRFNELLDEWKSVGWIPAEKNEALWVRFSAARKTFFERKGKNYEDIRREQEENYIRKEQLVVQAEAMQLHDNRTEATHFFNALMEQWKEIGRVPREYSEGLWNRLVTARNRFYESRREYREAVMNDLEANLEKKLVLVAKAEALRDSEDWRGTTELLSQLMSEWKQIGPVPRKNSDEIWEQFMASRKYFFARKDADRANRREAARQMQSHRISAAADLMEKIHLEIAEEQARLADFREALGNLEAGPRDNELKEHLEGLIRKSLRTIDRKNEKIVSLAARIDTLGGGQERSLSSSSDS